MICWIRVTFLKSNGKKHVEKMKKLKNSTWFGLVCFLFLNKQITVQAVF